MNTRIFISINLISLFSGRPLQSWLASKFKTHDRDANDSYTHTSHVAPHSREKYFEKIFFIFLHTFYTLGFSPISPSSRSSHTPSSFIIIPFTHRLLLQHLSPSATSASTTRGVPSRVPLSNVPTSTVHSFLTATTTSFLTTRHSFLTPFDSVSPGDCRPITRS